MLFQREKLFMALSSTLLQDEKKESPSKSCKPSKVIKLIDITGNRRETLKKEKEKEKRKNTIKNKETAINIFAFIFLCMKKSIFCSKI